MHEPLTPEERVLADALQQWHTVDPSPEIDARILAQARRATMTVRPRRRPMLVGFATAAALVLVVGVAWRTMDNPPPDSTPYHAPAGAVMEAPPSPALSEPAVPAASPPRDTLDRIEITGSRITSPPAGAMSGEQDAGPVEESAIVAERDAHTSRPEEAPASTPMRPQAARDRAVRAPNIMAPAAPPAPPAPPAPALPERKFELPPETEPALRPDTVTVERAYVPPAPVEVSPIPATPAPEPIEGAATVASPSDVELEPLGELAPVQATFEEATARIRVLLKKGDRDAARVLLTDLRATFPDRPLPGDLARFAREIDRR